MAEQALSYAITLIVVCNVTVIAGLVAIVALLPRMTRRRPAHRAETAPLRTRLTLVAGRTTGARRAAAPAARAA
jgi:hypothetical protein